MSPSLLVAALYWKIHVQGRVKKLTTAGPNDPNVFYSCSEDGTVRRFDLRLPADSEQNITVVSLHRPTNVELYSLGVESNTLACGTSLSVCLSRNSLTEAML